MKSLKESEIALASELYQTYYNQLQLLKSNEKEEKLQMTSQATVASSVVRNSRNGAGNQNILSRMREKLTRKSRSKDEAKVVSVAERAAGFTKVIEEKQKVREPIARESATRKSLTRSEVLVKGRRESDSDVSVDSGIPSKI